MRGAGGRKREKQRNKERVRDDGRDGRGRAYRGQSEYNRESRRKAAPERGLVPREWNTDQYQEPRRESSLCLFGPTPSAFGDLVLSRAFDESAREEILPIPLTPGDLIETTTGRKRNGSVIPNTARRCAFL